MGGSPCQDLSIAKKNREGLNGNKSNLFWEYVRLKKEIKPKYFILENVNSMPKEAKEIITKILKTEPIMINASLVSAQIRKRLYWTNIPNILQPKNRQISVNSIRDKDDEKYLIHKTPSRLKMIKKGRNLDLQTKAVCISVKVDRNSNFQYFKTKTWYRNLTPIECERLQCLPDNYTHGISDTSRYRVLGNSFNVDVIAHILKFIKNES